MPQLMNSEDRVYSLALAMDGLLVTGGPPAMTMRKIAGAAGWSPSTLLDHFGSRNHMLRVCLHASAGIRLEEMRWRVAIQGLTGLLPPAGDAHAQARIWAGWESIGRFEPLLERTLTDSHEEELHIIATALGSRMMARRRAPEAADADAEPTRSGSWTRPPLAATKALLDGIRWAMATPGSHRQAWADAEPGRLAMSHGAACTLLRDGVNALMCPPLAS